MRTVDREQRVGSQIPPLSCDRNGGCTSVCYPWLMDIAANTRPRPAVVLCALVLLFAHTPIRAAGPQVGQVVYGAATPLGAAPGEVLARMSFEMERCGPIFRTIWRGADDVIVAADELEEVDGILARYRFARPNVGEWAQVTRHGNNLRIEHFERGRVHTGLLSASQATVVGPMMALMAERGLRELSAGEQLQVHYAVPERLAVYDFTLASTAAQRGGLREVAVTANSWLVRQFANPVSLYFGADGQFAGMRGRALPVGGRLGRPQPLELDVRVLRRESRQCAPMPRADDWFRQVRPALAMGGSAGDLIRTRSVN